MADGAATDATAANTAASDATAANTPARSGTRTSTSDTEAAPTLRQIRYPCLMNMDYHATREAWLDGLHRWLMFFVIAAGASALFDAWQPMRIIGPVIAAVCGALDLTFDLSNRARTHAMFRRRYSELLSTASRNPDALHALRSDLDDLMSEEEPAFHAQLALSAMKAQQATYGKIVDPCRPGWWYRRLANMRRFEGYDFNT